MQGAVDHSFIIERAQLTPWLCSFSLVTSPVEVFSSFLSARTNKSQLCYPCIRTTHTLQYMYTMAPEGSLLRPQLASGRVPDLHLSHAPVCPDSYPWLYPSLSAYMPVLLVGPHPSVALLPLLPRSGLGRMYLSPGCVGNAACL